MGYVDFGDKQIDCNVVQKEAKEALTFLVTAINSNGKVPVAYFLVNGLTSNEKANILNEVLIFLNQSGIVITSVTLNPSKMFSCIKHPVTNENIYVFLDICHIC